MTTLFKSRRYTYLRLNRQTRRAMQVHRPRYLYTAITLIHRLRAESKPIVGFPEVLFAKHRAHDVTFYLYQYPDGKEFYTVTRYLPWYDVSEYYAAHDYLEAVKLFGRWLKPPSVRDLRPRRPANVMHDEYDDHDYDVECPCYIQ